MDDPLVRYSAVVIVMLLSAVVFGALAYWDLRRHNRDDEP